MAPAPSQANTDEHWKRTTRLMFTHLGVWFFFGYIGLVVKQQEPVELAPQNAYIRRLQHQMAERANLVSRSRGREPYRRVRLYPDPARTAWR